MKFGSRAYFLLLSTFLLFCSYALSQDQRIADELAVIYKEDTVQGLEKLDLLNDLSFNEINDFELALKYSEELISLSKLSNNSTYLSYGYFQKGNAKQYSGELEGALEAYFKCAEIAEKENFTPVLGTSYAAIADVYTISNNHKNAMLYYQRAIKTLRQTLRNKEDSVGLATTILNAGDALLTNKKYDSALVYFIESGQFFEQVDYAIGKAYNLGNIGIVYANTGDNELAEQHINHAIGILENFEDYYPVSVYLMTMADIYAEKGEHETAISYAKKSLTLAEQNGLREQIADANLKLSELYEILGDLVVSYGHYKKHITYRDSLLNIEKVQQLADQRTNFEVSQKQIEVELLETQKRNQLIVLGFIGLLLLASLWFYRIISKEKKKSEKLLLNILPKDTAKELKVSGKVKAQQYNSVSVLFTDFKGFTSYSENLSPEELVKTVDFYFSKFDAIIDKHNLEKIKTIGDAYMCVGGLHDSEIDHAQRMVTAAFEIAGFVEETKKDVAASDLTFDIRIGINSGPVVAGVVGTKKFAYDIWGDTVNVASRMESMSEPGRINISNSTFELIKADFNCDYRGEIEAKNRGKIKMYFVQGIKKVDLTVVG
ncbi:adenylate/guanylate cyclase domain-containing protein [Maribacter hydrothermalis]|uniref:Adenylate cyclase n=1 Tax=Maribacter hydrothermalis TaxID=1836467 RepID=A0A1B7Z885_9FLAO|nr:adenylate/guanylate cyclase domain-containing protein [Maribacter hydrothermalis]APQ19039.1 adenylate/guanylate cyclase domain-containing protein [Maribacter hydrothermalis]OBR38948.1 guanylate cyclase [Maribacter hydrothermalis]